MTQTPSALHPTTTAPQGFRDALAEMVQLGLSVARMVARVAEGEMALAEAAQAGVAEDVPAMAGSLAEAIEADRAFAAAAEARQTVVARAEAVAGAFARTSRAVRLTVLLAERIDRGWATRPLADDRAAMARRQVVRGVEEAIAREADGERAERLREALTDRLETLDAEIAFADRPPEEVMAAICRYLGLDAARDVVKAPVPGVMGDFRVRLNTVVPDGAKSLAETAPGWRPDG